MIDLHSHSTASDGHLSPAQLIDLACARKLKALALTDHDTCDGLEEAEACALGRGLRFIPGIEIEVEWPQKGLCHLLGLNILDWKLTMAALLTMVQARRQERNEGMIDAMQKSGMTVRLDDVRALSGGQVIGRPHFADYLIRQGIVRHKQEAFDRFLRPGLPFFVPYRGLAMDVAIAGIQAAGGKALLAHPKSLCLDGKDLKETLVGWKDMGLDGIEAWHPSVSFREARELEVLAGELQLLTSAGSDYHGDPKTSRQLGKTLEDKRKIEDRFLSCLN